MIDVQEIAFAAALEAVATGATKAATEAFIRQNWSSLDPALIPVVLRDALIDAENQGIEREDIDGSWYR